MILFADYEGLGVSFGLVLWFLLTVLAFILGMLGVVLGALGRRGGPAGWVPPLASWRWPASSSVLVELPGGAGPTGSVGRALSAGPFLLGDSPS